MKSRDVNFKWWVLNSLFCLLLIYSGCSCTSMGKDINSELNIPGWQSSSPEAQGMDSAVLADMIEYIESNYNIDSLMVIRNGVVVSESYFYPHTSEDLHAANSATKSVVAALIGICIKQGYIQSIMQPIWDFFPEVDLADFSRDKRSITIKDLLTMTSGFEWVSISNGWQQISQGNIAHNILARELTASPGKEFTYDSLGSHLLSIIIERATGKKTYDFAREMLFAPLEIGNVRWLTEGTYYWGGFGSYWKTRDMAKLGLLYANSGIWEGEEILPPQWTDRSGIPYINVFYGYGAGLEYGLHWWVNSDLNYYTANGAWGQRILVLPEENIVFVMTAFLDDTQQETVPPLLVDRYILGALRSDLPIPENYTALKRLRNLEWHAASEPEKQKIVQNPSFTAGINGFFYKFEKPGSTLWNSCSFIFDNADEEARLLLNNWDLPLGLDGIYRFSTQYYPSIGDTITAASRGRWKNDSTFEVDLVFEDGYHYNLEFIFEYNRLKLTTYIRDWVLEDYGNLGF